MYYFTKLSLWFKHTAWLEDHYYWWFPFARIDSHCYSGWQNSEAGNIDWWLKLFALKLGGLGLKPNSLPSECWLSYLNIPSLPGVTKAMHTRKPAPANTAMQPWSSAFMIVNPRRDPSVWSITPWYLWQVAVKHSSAMQTLEMCAMPKFPCSLGSWAIKIKDIILKSVAGFPLSETATPWMPFTHCPVVWTFFLVGGGESLLNS